MEEAAQQLLNYRHTGMGVMEMSHRSREFEDIIAQAEQRIRQLLYAIPHLHHAQHSRATERRTVQCSLTHLRGCGLCGVPLLCVSAVPASYGVLFMQGGATSQFSAVPLNLLGAASSAAYLVTGAWSAAAAEEARRFVPTVHVVADTGPAYTSFPAPSSYSVPADCAYLHYCHNETVHGVEAPCLPSAPAAVPLVADCSSSFLSRPLDVSAHALVYAGAQKNVGPAGVTIVIVRSALIASTPHHPHTPLMLQYQLQASKLSMYNTPPTFAVYMVGLVLAWLQRQGGLSAMEERNVVKSGLLYAAIDGSGGFYEGLVEKASRSRMNAVFRVRERQLEPLLVKEAEGKGLVGIAGHRSVGGLRASLYNAVTIDDVQALISFLHAFQVQHGTPRTA